MASSTLCDETKPKVLILGGVGFVGRNLAQYIVENNLASKLSGGERLVVIQDGLVRVVDKVPPQTAWLNKKHQELFAHPTVEYKSANLINQASVTSAFTCEDGEFDFAVNLAAETKFGQTDPVYKEGIVKLSFNCATESAQRGVKKYIELSTGLLGSSSKSPMTENCKPDPWTSLARFKLMVEEKLKSIPNLNYVIIRPATIYGTGDRTGLTPRLVVGAVYKHLGEMMKQLWTKDLKVNTVHVHDVCRAIWHLFYHGKNGEIYNVVDAGNTTQGTISDIVSEIFNINHDYLGNAMSTIAKIDMTTLVEEINDLHLAPWFETCNQDGITHTPLSPYIDQEQIYRRDLFLDGTKLESSGFAYSYPKITKELVMEVINDYAEMGIFPKSVLS